MPSVAINPPKTPVTKGSSGVAAATLPNICKMPPPPPPFVPTPLPNIGQSGKQPQGYSTSVKIEGQPVAVRGASFGSSGDIASKATGGGIVSNNAEGPTKFAAPGSLDVTIEGKNVQLLSDQMLNNCGPAGSPPNSATLQGLVQGVLVVFSLGEGDLNCPHPNMERDDGNERRKREKAEMSQISESSKARTKLNQAVKADQRGRPAVANQLLAQAVEAERQAAAIGFEREVAKQTEAKETGVTYYCPDCGMQGELDTVTKNGVVKECKQTGAAASYRQLQKHKSAVGVLFPGAPVHIAVPAGCARDVTPAIDRSAIQEH